MSAERDSAASSQDWKLCYVEGSWAWFTTDFANQWGDDWNDAPYEHNAGTPYEWHSYMADRGIEPYQILRVAWDAPWITTPDEGHLNSPWSVEQINAGATAWLIDPNYGQRPRVQSPVVFGGASLEDFIAAIEERNGTVYLPKERDVVAD